MLATLTLPAGHEMPALQRARTVRVRSADELRSALRHAREHSLTLDGSGLDRVLRLDSERGMIEVQAATPWSTLVSYLASRNVPLEAFSRTSGLPATVGEAVSQAAAGPDGLPVSAHVVAMTLVTPDGELRRADRGSNRELFGLALGGQGVIGVLYSVTLSTDSLRRSAAEAIEPVELSIAQTKIAPAADCAIECLVPPAELDAYLREIRSIVEDRRLALHAISVHRYQSDRHAFLSPARQEWAGVQLRFGLKSTLGASVGAAELRRALLDAALKRGGSFPIRDLRDATRRQLEACYPMLGAFLAEKRRSDPADRLQNGWYRQLRAKLRCEPCEVRWGR